MRHHKWKGDNDNAKRARFNWSERRRHDDNATWFCMRVVVGPMAGGGGPCAGRNRHPYGGGPRLSTRRYPETHTHTHTRRRRRSLTAGLVFSARRLCAQCTVCIHFRDRRYTRTPWHASVMCAPGPRSHRYKSVCGGPPFPSPRRRANWENLTDVSSARPR